MVRGVYLFYPILGRIQKQSGFIHSIIELSLFSFSAIVKIFHVNRSVQTTGPGVYELTTCIIIASGAERSIVSSVRNGSPLPDIVGIPFPLRLRNEPNHKSQEASR